MKSEWRVSSNIIGGDKMYIAYRLRDVSEVDHSGNREYYGEYTADKDFAIALAAELNNREENNND